MSSITLMEAYRDERLGIRIVCRTDGHLTSGSVQALTRLSTITIHDLLFADDCVLNTTTEKDTEWSIEFLATGSVNIGMIIYTDKMVVMHQPSLNAQHHTPPRITADGNNLKIVDNFAYQRSTLPCSTGIDDEVAHRISEPSQAFGRLQAPCGIAKAFNWTLN
ncbi:hypothetical protein SprV_0200761600 [Sparganum proliferum]